MASRKIEVEIIGDASSLERALGKGTESASKFHKGLKVASIGAVAALGAIGVGAKIAFDELSQATKVSAQTEAVLKSTGGAAHVTSKQVDELASSLLQKSGVDDEAIKSGENMLLTFTKIRNETGKGNDVFNQATRAVLDMDTAMSHGNVTAENLSKTSILVGKALNDPVKGATALRRVGVDLDEQQKALIETLVKSGDTMGAQKIILAELTKEFGGSAEAAGKTFSGQMNIAKENARNFGAQLVQGAIPALTGLAHGLQTATTFMSEHQTATKVLIGVIGGLSVMVLAVSAAMKVAAAAQAIMTAAQWALNVALDANPIGIVILAIAALGAGVVIAYQKSQTFRDVVSGAFQVVKTVVATVINAVLSYIDLYMAGLQKLFEVASHIPFIGDKFRGVADAIGDARDRVQGLKSAIDGLHDKTVTVTTVVQQIAATGDAVHHRATGGPVTAGRPYIVGERRPELFVPNVNGTIVPSVPSVVGTGGGGGGSGQPINIYVAGSVLTENDLVDVVRRGLYRVGNRNGTLGFA